MKMEDYDNIKKQKNMILKNKKKQMLQTLLINLPNYYFKLYSHAALK